MCLWRGNKGAGPDYDSQKAREGRETMHSAAPVVFGRARRAFSALKRLDGVAHRFAHHPAVSLELRAEVDDVASRLL